jgi:hypothetical protein
MERAILAGSAIALLVFGCAPATSYIGGVALTPASSQQKSERVSDVNFTIGTSRTVVVGEPLVRVKDYRRIVSATPMVQATEEAAITLPAARLSVPSSSELPLLTSIDGRRFARIGGNAVEIDDAGVFSGHVMQMTGPGSYEPIEGVATIVPSSVRFAPRSRVSNSTTAEGENFEIVFTGRDATSVRFQYREYTSDDMARAAFSQDLTYPVSANVIRFRNLTIEIVNLGADSITYRVVERRLEN